jgi:hypothetical protein
MQGNERVADDAGHMIDRGRVCPVRIMNRGEGDALCL